MNFGATLTAVVLGLLAIAGIVCLRRVAADRRDAGRLGVATASLIWGLYFSFTALTAFIAWSGVWLLPLSRPAALLLGGVAFAFGLTLVVGGMRAFRSVARISGRDHDELIQHGIYRWTRNPQNVGWGAALVGVALMGRSGLALIFAMFFLIAFRLYVPAEERHMERCFGDAWHEYCEVTPRFFGRPETSSAIVLRERRSRWKKPQPDEAV